MTADPGHTEKSGIPTDDASGGVEKGHRRTSGGRTPGRREARLHIGVAPAVCGPGRGSICAEREPSLVLQYKAKEDGDMPKRRKERDAAKAEYIAQISQGEKISLRQLAETMGVSYQTLRNWKTEDQWDKSLPKKKRGGQPGNKNSKGKKNAAGSHPGAPVRNKNAEKDGAYSAVFFDALSEEERKVLDKLPLTSKEALEHEMQILKFRENKILTKIAEYEKADPETLYLTSTISGDMDMKNKDSAFVRVLKLQEALNKVQGRIAKVADSLRAIEESKERMGLERERLDIMRMRATGQVDVPDPEDPDGVEVPDDLGGDDL